MAKIWDKLEKILPKGINYLNPNKNLRNLISNSSSRETLIFNGDMVDYLFDSYWKYRSTNWRIFFKLTSPFVGKILINLGNHDYRRAPYNLGVYKLEHVNISEKVRKKYSKKIGNNKFRFLRELDSIRVNVKKFNPIPRRVIRGEKSASFRSSKILMLNTRYDALTKLSSLLKISKWHCIYSGSPCSIGLKMEEISKLREELSHRSKKELIILLHCPPFGSKRRIPKIYLSQKTYEEDLKRFGLSKETFLENNWNFIDCLLKSTRNITVITSHSHFSKEYLINKKTKILQDASIEKINKLRKKPGYVKFVSTLPLGALSFRKKIGYLRIDNDTIEHVRI